MIVITHAVSDVSFNATSEWSEQSVSEADETEESKDDDMDQHLLSDGEEQGDIFTEKLYPGSTLSVGASCVFIMQFCRKYKLPRVEKVIYYN